jgi:signal transduction histidine kinase
MSAEFWDRTIIGIYFFYGLAFYSMGLGLLLESGRASELGLARSMRLLAGFGLLHGCHEWLDMLDQELMLHYDRQLPLWLVYIRLALLVASFLALIAFGEHLLASEGRFGTLSWNHRETAEPARNFLRRMLIVWRITIFAAVFYVFSAVAVQLVYQMSDREWAQGADVLSRYIVGMPGAVIACIALLNQRISFQKRGVGFTRDLTIAAIALILYGLVGQVFVGKGEVFPSGFLNANLFENVFGFPVQLFRAGMAITVAIFMIRVLRALEVESQLRLEAAENARIEAERRNHEETARLNAELRRANAETTRLLREVQYRDALRGELLQRITTAQENERRRIARELHDGTGQMLTGVALGLRGTAQLSCENLEKIQQRLSELEKMATTAIGELRILINDLRPPQLDDMGLIAALRWQIDSINQRCDFFTKLDVTGDPVALPPEIETTLFRIVQEGLTNIIKHAKATQVDVTLNFCDGLTLTVRDDGVGFSPAAMMQDDKLHKAWGLIGMQERAGLINATLKLESAPGEGSTLTVTLQDSKEDNVESET